MEKLTILLLVAAVLMSTQALVERAGENRSKENIKFLLKRKRAADRGMWGKCKDGLTTCLAPSECCSGNCEQNCKMW
uniref:Conotoxin TxMEKL-011 n=2 Tax=Conus TaxID=6490 RepID=O2611_CONTE|nr:RecName: Full=Conotoxin LeD51; Flags: Precursor [Conus litteratus]Q9BPB7.1 RecName: Full=Conotoxin TxMEKL-011; Flags: Precursor [Conus textile]AAG60445.1 conotoxin scaffold VI/VII precursor [Conus textile]AAZ83757.1 LeD51P [Conus litteratus]